jgi:hypothetical protein
MDDTIPLPSHSVIPLRDEYHDVVAPGESLSIEELDVSGLSGGHLGHLL